MKGWLIKLKCKHCGKEIDYLDYTESVISCGKAYIEDNSIVEYDERKIIPCDDGIELRCPECNEIIKYGVDIDG